MISPVELLRQSQALHYCAWGASFRDAREQLAHPKPHNEVACERLNEWVSLEGSHDVDESRTKATVGGECAERRPLCWGQVVGVPARGILAAGGILAADDMDRLHRVHRDLGARRPKLDENARHRRYRELGEGHDFGLGGKVPATRLLMPTFGPCDLLMRRAAVAGDPAMRAPGPRST